MSRIAIEALLSSEIQEFTLQGEEIYKEPSTRSKNLKKNLRKFGQILDFLIL